MKHDVEARLKTYLKESKDGEEWWREALDYMKTLSPSGVELEIINLTSFDFSEELKDDPDYYVSAHF